MGDVKHNLLWSGVERFSVQGIQFILSLVLARIVGPKNFGLIAMLSVFIAIAQTFTESGFGNALIQKNNRTESDYSTVFYFNLIIAILLYIILYFCSPYIARFYNEPILSPLAKYVALDLIASSLCIIQRTRLRILANFKLIAIISFIAVFLSGTVGIIMALRGYGVWSLVGQSLSFRFAQAVLFWISSKWKPKTGFSWISFRSLFSFGSKLLVSGLLHTIYLNLYSLVIGKFYNSSDVGFYNRSSTITQYVPTNIMNILTNVIYPLQCEHQNDDLWLKSTFPKFLRLGSYLVFPIMIYIAVMSKSLVSIILSEDWIFSATLISILSIGYMWMVLGILNNFLIAAMGKSDLFLKAEIIKKCCAIVILFSTLPFGVTWLCIGIVIYNVIDVLIISIFTKQIINITPYNQLKTIFPILILCLISAGCTFLSITFCNTVLKSLICGTVIYIVCFVVGSLIFKFNEFQMILQIVKKNTNINY